MQNHQDTNEANLRFAVPPPVIATGIYQERSRAEPTTAVAMPVDDVMPRPEKRVAASGHKGIYQKGDKWEFQLKRSGTLHYYGRYPSKEAAVEALRAFERNEPVPKPDNRNEATRGSSGIKGISKGYKGKWVARGKHDGKYNIYLGCFEDIEDAKAAIADHEANEGTPGYVGPRANVGTTSTGSSNVRGVTRRGENKWRATGRRDGNRVNLGVFLTIDEAKSTLDAFNAGTFEPKASRGWSESYVAPGIKTVNLKFANGVKYQVNIKRDNKNYSLGNYDTQEDAQNAIDQHDAGEKIVKPKWQRAYGEEMENPQKSASGILGVTRRGEMWKASCIAEDNKRQYLGTFKTKEEAADAIKMRNQGEHVPKKGRGRPRNQVGPDGPTTSASIQPLSVSTVPAVIATISEASAPPAAIPRVMPEAVVKKTGSVGGRRERDAVQGLAGLSQEDNETRASKKARTKR